MLLVVAMLAFAAGCGGDDERRAATVRRPKPLGARKAARWSSRRPRTRSCSTARSSRTASRCARSTRCSRGSSASSRARPRSSRPWRELGGERGRHGLDVQAARGRHVPRRRAVQRRGRLLQLRPLVQLQGLVPEPERELLLADRVRRLRDRRGRRPGRQPLRELRGHRRDDRGADLTNPSASFLGALSLWSFSIASPKALQEYGADEGTLDADGVFHPTGTYGTEHPIGHRPVQVRVVDARRPSRARTTTTGATRPSSTS